MTDIAPWRASLHAGQFGQAHARALAHGEDPLLVVALEDLDALSLAIRAKQYPQARRLIERYRDSAQRTPLAAYHDLSGLNQAVDSLENNEGQKGPTEVALLKSALTPAFEHPLTRAEAHNAVGILHALREEAAQATQEFEAALAFDPNHYRAITNQGNLLLEAGQYAEAEEHYRRALKINNDYPGAHHNLAVALRRQKKLGASVRSLKTSQRLGMRQSRQQGQDEFRQILGKVGAGKHLNVRQIQIGVGVVLAALLFFALRGGFHL